MIYNILGIIMIIIGLLVIFNLLFDLYISVLEKINLQEYNKRQKAILDFVETLEEEKTKE